MKKFNLSSKKNFNLFLLVSVMMIYLSAFTILTNSPENIVQDQVGPEDWKDYKSWYKVTKEPNTGDPTGFLDGKHGGTGAFRDIFVNKKGEAVMKGEADFPYPEGTVIVKEAFKNKKRYDEQKKPELTIMVKQATGTAPDTNDWLFVMGANGKNTGTGMDSKWGKFCGSCHINSISKDFTFMAADK